MEKDKLLKRPKNWIIKIKEVLFKNRTRSIITIIVLVVIAFISYKAFFGKSAKPQYQTIQVATGSIVSSVSESGNITAGQTSVTSPTDGIISAIYVKNGDQVKAGDKLFKVTSTATAQVVASAYAQYESAVNSATTAQQGQTGIQATLEQARQAVITASSNVTTMQNNLNNSYNNPATKQAYTQNDIDAINSALTSARETFSEDQQKYTQYGTQIAASQAQENSAYLAYLATQDSTVTAPVSGTVGNLSSSVGGNVSSGTNSSNALGSSSSSSTSSSSNATTVLIIGNFSNMQVKVEASEVDAPSIHAGEKVTITLDAFPGKTFAGKVSSVDTVGTNSSGVVTYNAYITFDYFPQGVQPGMSATVNIQTARADNVLTVPSSAIQTSSGQATVRVLQNGQVTSVPVETGISDDTNTEITSGLSEGDTVITSVVIPATSSTGTSPFSGITGGRGGGFGGAAGGGGAARGGGGRGG